MVLMRRWIWSPLRRLRQDDEVKQSRITMQTQKLHCATLEQLFAPPAVPSWRPIDWSEVQNGITEATHTIPWGVLFAQHLQHSALQLLHQLSATLGLRKQMSTGGWCNHDPPLLAGTLLLSDPASLTDCGFSLPVIILATDNSVIFYRLSCSMTTNSTSAL